MSRIGKKPISLPEKVALTISPTGVIVAEGPRGRLEYQLPRVIRASVRDKSVVFERSTEDRKAKALHGLARALVNNMIVGVNTGYSKDLEIQGVGFKAAVKGELLDLSLGYSHPIHFKIPKGIKIGVAENTKLKIEGIDKHLVGQVAADIRAFYPPEPYKGKGVRYAGEQIVRKEGKTVQ
jgi:large subunit ribosomal protein L6